MKNIWMQRGATFHGMPVKAEFPLTVTDAHAEFLVTRGEARYDENETPAQPFLRTADDPFGLNVASANRADEVLARYAHKQPGANQEVLTNLLVDIMHWADRNNCSIDWALADARQKYQDEVEVQQ